MSNDLFTIAKTLYTYLNHIFLEILGYINICFKIVHKYIYRKGDNELPIAIP